LLQEEKQRRKEKIKSSVSDEALLRIVTISEDCPVSQQHKTLNIKHPATWKPVDQSIRDVKAKETSDPDPVFLHLLVLQFLLLSFMEIQKYKVLSGTF
jgi:hypothetical protein